MGSFSSTCCISGLPIEAGDAVRYLLLTENPYCEGGFVCDTYGRFVPRTWPIKAEYNDYGSIENWEAGAVQESFMAGFQRDLVEVGVGDNSCHDVAARKDMTFEQLLEAVWEGRVRVQREAGMQTREEMRARMAAIKGDDAPVWPPDYIPTLAAVEEVLSGVSLPEGGRFLVDEQADWTRVRWDGLSGAYGKDLEYLALAQGSLQGRFATVITAGGHNDLGELRVFVPPGKTPEGHRRTSEWGDQEEGEPLLVQQAMIREDVWQALIGLERKVWGKVYTVDGYRKDAGEGVRKAGETFSRVASLESRLEDMDEDLRMLLLDAKFGIERGGGPGAGLLSKEIIPFMMGLNEHAQIILESGKVPEDFGDVVGEFTFIFHLLMGVGYVWRPSDTAGPQFGEWGMHASYLKAVLQVADVAAAKEAAERAADEE